MILFRTLPDEQSDLASLLRFDLDLRLQQCGVTTPSSDRTMANSIPQRNLTPALCQRLQSEMLTACQDASARHGLVVEAQEVTDLDLRWGFDAAFHVCISYAGRHSPRPRKAPV